MSAAQTRVAKLLTTASGTALVDGSRKLAAVRQIRNRMLEEELITYWPMLSDVALKNLMAAMDEASDRLEDIPLALRSALDKTSGRGFCPSEEFVLTVEQEAQLVREQDELITNHYGSQAYKEILPVVRKRLVEYVDHYDAGLTGARTPNHSNSDSVPNVTEPAGLELGRVISAR